MQTFPKVGLDALLTPENCAVLLIDHQPSQLANVNSHDPTLVINNVTALAKTAKAYGVPTILTTINAKRGGEIFKQIQAVFPDQKPIDRSFINSWEDRRVVEAVKNTGRKKLVIAALWSEMCLAQPAIHAMGDGWRTAARLGAHRTARSSRADPVRPCRRFRHRTGVGAGQRGTARVGVSMKTILITGVTGHQGGAVAQALQNKGFHLRGLTRNPESERAAALAGRGVDVVKGDLDDEATLRRALTGAWGVFGVQTALEAGVEREEEQGKRLATMARESGVEHYVYTSVGSAHKRTGIPHFDNKWRIEETVRGLRFPSHVILRPAFFMENLLAPYSLRGDTLSSALGPDTKLQMIAVDDIGWFGARAFTDAAALNRREIDIAGDLRTMPEAAQIFTNAVGRPIAFARTPIEQVRQYSEDTALMLEWFERVGYSADIAGLEREFGRTLTKLPDWAAKVEVPT